MRVWIISDKRWADSDETHWVGEVVIDPDPYGPETEVWDRVQYRSKRYCTKASAIRGVKRSKSNVISVGDVYRRHLERVEGTIWNWTNEDREETDCIYEPALCFERSER